MRSSGRRTGATSPRDNAPGLPRHLKLRLPYRCASRTRGARNPIAGLSCARLRLRTAPTQRRLQPSHFAGEVGDDLFAFVALQRMGTLQAFLCFAQQELQ
jgi:hypothetical protein